MKNTLLYIALVFAIISCNKPVEVKPTHKNLVLKITDLGEGLINNYTYNTQNQLINMTRNSNKYNPTLDMILSYNANGTLNEHFERGSIYKTRYKYNEDGTIKGKEEYSVENGKVEVLNRYEYSYANGEVTERYFNEPNKIGWRNICHYDSKNNLTQIEVYNKVTLTNTEGNFNSKIFYGNYDAKNHYASMIPSEYFFPYSNKNNIGFQQYGETSYKYKFTYEYNEDGYPIKKTGAIEDVVTFEYKRL